MKQLTMQRKKGEHVKHVKKGNKCKKVKKKGNTCNNAKKVEGSKMQKTCKNVNKGRK